MSGRDVARWQLLRTCVRDFAGFGAWASCL